MTLWMQSSGGIGRARRAELSEKISLVCDPATAFAYVAICFLMYQYGVNVR